MILSVSHPHIIAPKNDIHILRLFEHEAIDEIDAEQERDHMYLEQTGRLGRIRDHVLSVMGSGVVESGTAEWENLEAIMQEVHEGLVYRRRCGRGDMGLRATQ